MPERKIAVLLVEDNAGLLDTLADILRVMDMDVDTALDAPVAFGLLNERRYDVAVVDMVLPGASGVEVIRRLKASSPDTRVIVCTAYYNSELLVEAQALGIDRTVHKPTDPAVLIGLIKELSGSPEPAPSVEL
jgi:two-component system, NtrC family, C4-dicarboxylate transport response regulator DctD